ALVLMTTVNCGATAPYRFDHFSIVMLHIRDMGWKGSFGILFTHWTSLNVGCLAHHLFQCIIVICLICINTTPFWNIKLEGLARTYIAGGPWGEEAFDGLSIFGDHQMNFESIKITFLAGDVASI